MNNNLWALLRTVWLISSTLLCASAHSKPIEGPSIAYMNVAKGPSGELSATILYPLLDFFSLSEVTIDGKPKDTELAANQLIIERWLNEHFGFTADNQQDCAIQVDPAKLRSTKLANLTHIEIGATLDCQAERQLRVSYLASVVNLPKHQLIFTSVEHGHPVTRLFNRRQESLVWTLEDDKQHTGSDHLNAADLHRSHNSSSPYATATSDQSTLVPTNHSQHHAEGPHSTDHLMGQSTNQSASEHAASNHVGGSPISGKTVLIVCTVVFVGGLFATWRVIRHM